ncbi:MAG: antiporter, partial [Rubrivivax sp.]|nr:antiporter [Rubrivivax sp.]
MNNKLQASAVASSAPRSGDIEDWRPEDATFWETTGKRIAYRNLWISIPNLLCAFAVWLMWGIITVQMLNLGFPFKPAELFTLTAIAGLMGATLRIPASFFIRLSGGRNTVFLTSAMLIIPAIWTGIALQDKSTPLWVFQACAFLSGIGGGNFSASMSNINTFFPKKQQGLALGLNAGLGNFGVTTMQILIPLVMTVGLFGAVGGGSMVLVKDSGWIFGKILAGTPTWIQNAGFVWAAILVPLVIAAWFGMNNLLTVTPKHGGTLAAFGKIIYLYGLAFAVGALGLYLYLPAPTGLGLLNMWVALPLIIVGCLGVMKMAAFGEMKGNLAKQFEIFRNKHTWSMTILYIVTFGSFIGFSMALPLSITVIFGFQHIPDANGV